MSHVRPRGVAILPATSRTLLVPVAAAMVCACSGDGPPELSLDDFLPELQPPTGASQSAWAGAITAGNPEELIPGPAASGMVGDCFMHNRHGRYVIQAPTRVMGVVPSGGNLVDAVPLADDGSDAASDHFGELFFNTGEPATRARVGVFRDGDGDGQIGDLDVVLSSMDADDTGGFSGQLPSGNYLVRAEVENIAHSGATSLALGAGGMADVALEVSQPVSFDYSIIDGESGMPMPGRLTVVGHHPAQPDTRLLEAYERAGNAVLTAHAAVGTTVDSGDGADAPLRLPAGATYRMYASRGTEWSVASQTVTVTPGMPGADLTFELARVAPAEGYVASEFHVHQLGSMDSPITNERRVVSMLAEGVALFASTDHDHVSDLQPVIEAMGHESQVRNITGLEVTPFAYGHVNAWPITPDPMTPNRAAIDWAEGMAGYAMILGEIFGAMRSRGDTHDAYRLPSGMPRTYVRVTDDSAAALASGEVVNDSIATMTGAAPRDVVLSNGPSIQVALAGQGQSALGAVLDGSAGSVTLDIGQRAIFPLVTDGVLDETTIDIFVGGTPEQQDAALTGVGTPATALTSPVYIDFDGNGYTAVLSPQ